MTIETEIASLTTATTNLLTAVNVSKTTLDAKRDEAAASALAAWISEGTATTQAEIATTQASEAAASAALADSAGNATIAQTSAATATTQASTATAAKVAAESARDAAIIGAGVYTTEALGRAAVADGVAFKVQGSGDVAAYEYRRTNSTTSVLIATYPSSSAFNALSERTPIFTPGPNLFNKNEVITDYALQEVTGTPYPIANYVISPYMLVTAGGIYTKSTGDTTKVGVWYDQNKTIISVFTWSTANVTAPAGAKYLRTTVSTTAVPTFTVAVGTEKLAYVPYSFSTLYYTPPADAPNTPPTLDSASKLRPSVLPLLIPTINLYDKSTRTNLSYVEAANGLLFSHASYGVTDYIAVVAGSVYSKNDGTAKNYAWYNASKAYISGGFATGAITAPTGACYIRLTISAGLLETYQFELGESSTAFVQFGYYLDAKVITPQTPRLISSWYGKKVIAIGDSITRGFIPRNAPGYPGTLSPWLTVMSGLLGMSAVNYGIDGTTISANATNTTLAFTRRYSEMVDNADLIIVAGGTNDARLAMPLGVMGDTTDATFYGALDVMCLGLITKYYHAQGLTVGSKKQLLFLTPIKTGTSLSPSFALYVAAIKQVCEYYSIPVLDLYNLSGINPHIYKTVVGTVPGYTDTYNEYIPDGVHPNQDGQNKIGGIVAAFVANLTK